MTAYYSTGTVSVGAGSTTLTGVGTAWTTAGLRAGDQVILAGLTVPVAAIVSATQITLARAWPGGAQAAANYDIQYIFDDARALTAANLLLQALGGGTLTSLAGLASAANQMPYWTGSGVMNTAALTAAARGLLDDADAAAMRTTLGVVRTTSVTDTTAGRLIGAGDGGLLGVPPVWSTSFDDAPLGTVLSSDQITEQQAIDRDLPTVPGSLTTTLRFYVVQTHGLSNRTMQKAVEIFGIGDGRKGKTYHRVKHDAAWSAWRLAYDATTALMPVAQSGGTPTGGLIERGTNASGDFVRFADGTLICTHALAASAGAAVTWTFPSAFIAVPVVTGSAQATVLSAVCLDAVPTTTAATFSARDKTDARRADTCRMTAIGRWF